MYISIDLSECFNHKVIIDPEEYAQCKATLDNIIMYDMFTLNNFPQSDYEVRGISFKRQLITYNKYDNISCENQKIKIPRRKYNRVHYVGFCEIGRFREKIILLSAKRKVAECDVFFYQWSIGGNTVRTFDIKDEHCMIAFTDEKEKQNDWLYYYFSTIDNDSCEIDEILLPDNPFVHIVAMTLEF